MNLTVSVRNSIKTKITATMLLIFLAGLWSLSFYAVQMLRQDMERLLGEQQFSTVSVVADSINNDLNERIMALELVARTLDSSKLKNPEYLQEFLHQLIVLQAIFNGGLHIAGKNGATLVSEPYQTRANYADREAVQAVLYDGKVAIGRPIMDPLLKQVLFSITVPIHDVRGTVIGALTGDINLEMNNFLDKITNGVYGKTGGYIIVSQKYRQVVTATDKRRATEMLPAPGLKPLIDRFVQGYEGTGVIVNKDGVEVLASAKAIPIAAWYVAASFPTKEAFSPIHDMQQRMLLATIFLTLLAGGLAWRLMQNQLTPILAAARALVAMSEKNQQPQTLSISRKDEIGQLISGFNHLLQTLLQRDEELRIAAKAFECQEGILVLDGNWIILRSNQAFNKITGYTQQESQDQPFVFLKFKSDLHPDFFYARAYSLVVRTGSWQGEVSLRDKTGKTYFALGTITAVKDEKGMVSHYVCNLMDTTNKKLEEEQRLLNESAHRNILVREVHHRIKNNLQGITGILRQFSLKYPQIANPINQAISHVQSISVIHGLQGGVASSQVGLHELSHAIAGEVARLWQTIVTVDISTGWTPCNIAENEAVPIALVLNELLLNAVKHSDKPDGCVRITLTIGARPDVAQIRIVNNGKLDINYLKKGTPHSGLQLVLALMPRYGANLSWNQHGAEVMTILELEHPVIFLDSQK